MLAGERENIVFIINKNEQLVYPFFKVPENEVFIMGDNRGHTTDSSDYGSLPIENVIGKVDYLVKNNYWQVFDIILKIITFKGSNI